MRHFYDILVDILTLLSFLIRASEFVYGLLRGQVRNLANKNRTENPRGFSEVGENKQLLIAIVVYSFFISVVFLYPFFGAKF
ncbi:hypothetical protein EJA19_01945 [Mangrovimonas spongiae]|uniref:Uncharacterized protein n=1 Tax=Mangrovimonas spongiae TaxID=2494697 RepID=A0A3R9MJ68_9FLAO|nr:hypothetical protein EJA19_01945 [Mangrovimonas spongiae]